MARTSQLDLTQGAFEAMMKELYPAGVPENVATRRHPFLNMIKKKDDFEGDALIIPIIYENPGGRAATFADAQTYANASKSLKWVLTQKADYGVVYIDALAIRSSRSNKGAFVNARKTEIDLMLKALGNSAAHSLYRGGYGAIAQSETNVPGGTDFFECVDHDDARHFSVGMTYEFADGSDGSTPRTTFQYNVCSAVNEETGIITFEADLNGDIESLDYVFPVGDTVPAGTQLKMTGLAAWVPLTTPSGGESFFGVDRSVHPTRLAGHRLNATGNSIEENILTLSESIVRAGGAPDKCFISHGNFNNLIKGLGTKVEYDGAGGKADVGFGGVQIHTSAGPVMVHPDPDCPSDRGYCLQMDTWAIHHLDGFPHIDTLDGNNALRQSAADGIEVRARYWGELACVAPAWNGVFAI